MKRCCQVVGVLLLTAVAAMCAQSAAEPRPSKADKSACRRRARSSGPAARQIPGARNPDAPKGGGAPRLGNPGNPVERLMAMPPEKREQVLEKLPPQQQANLRRAPGSLRQTARRGTRAPEPDVEHVQQPAAREAGHRHAADAGLQRPARTRAGRNSGRCCSACGSCPRTSAIPCWTAKRSRTGSLRPNCRCWPISPRTTLCPAARPRSRSELPASVYASLTASRNSRQNLLYSPENFDSVAGTNQVSVSENALRDRTPAARSSDEEDGENRERSRGSPRHD